MLKRILPLGGRASASFTPLVRPCSINYFRSSKYATLSEKINNLNLGGPEVIEELDRRIKALSDQLAESPTGFNEVQNEKLKEYKHKKSQLFDLEKEKLDRQRTFYLQQMHNSLYLSSVSGVFKAASDMKQAGLKPDIHIMNYVISAFAYTRRTDTAFVMFDQIFELGLTPNSKTLESLLKACDVGSEWQRAQAIVAKMRDIGVWPEIGSHIHLISIYAKCSQYELAWAEYEALKALFNAIPTDLLKNLLRITFQTRAPDWTFQFIEELASNKIYISQEDISQALEIFLLSKNLKGCMRLHEIVPNSIEEGTLIQILNLAGRERDLQAIATIFHAIRILTGDTPSRAAYFALLVSCVHSRKSIEFLDAVNTLANAGHKLGGAFCVQFARICNTPAELDAARDHLEALRANGSFVSVDALGAVMRACARAGEMDRALELFQNCLQTYQLVPDVEAFNSIIEACEKANNLDGATNVVYQMEQNGVKPTAATYNHLINACVNAANFERAISALSDMQQNSIQPTYQIYAKLADLCASVGEHVQASAIVEAMKSAGMVPEDYLLAVIHAASQQKSFPE